MSRFAVLFLLVVIASISLIDAQRICPQNEEYKECGTACEPNCAYPDPSACIDVCVERCQCLHGYKRNSNGHCVLSKDC